MIRISNKGMTRRRRKAYTDSIQIRVKTNFTDPMSIFEETLFEWKFPKRPIVVRCIKTNEIEIIKSDYDLTCWFGINDCSLNKFIFSPIR